jgi:hypothetical protein
MEVMEPIPHTMMNSPVQTFENVRKMEQSLKVWHAVVSFISLSIVFAGIIVNWSTKMEAARLRIEILESSQRDDVLRFKEMKGENNAQYKEIDNKLNNMLLILQNKQDRK